MNRKTFRRITGFAVLSVIVLCPFAEAQRLGNTPLRQALPTRQATPVRPATPPNIAALQTHFGDGSVIHRDVTPPASRPNLSGQNLQNVNRQNLNQVRQNFGPDNREQIFNKADHTAINIDGPDWKNWQNINTQRINNTVINKINIDNRSVNIIRDNFNRQYNRNDFFTADWYARHPSAWHPYGAFPYPSAPYWWWHPSWDHSWAWFTAGFFAGAVANAVLTPVPYYYGSNIVYIDNTVYVNSVPYVSSTEYYRQAQSIAQAGATLTPQPQQQSVPADTQQAANPADEWLPMGTFAVVADGNQTESKRILQLATNKQGQVRGNFINQETEAATELYGSVDPQTQRVAFKAKGNDSVIAECGLWNLTQDTVPMLVHLDQNRTEERTLVRLTNDEAAAAP